MTKIYKMGKWEPTKDGKGKERIIVSRGYCGAKTMGQHKIVGSLLCAYSKRPVSIIRATRVIALREKAKGNFLKCDYPCNPLLKKRMEKRKGKSRENGKENRYSWYVPTIADYREEHKNLDQEARALNVKFPQEVDMPPKRGFAFYVSYIPTKKRLTLREKKKRLK